MRSTGRVTDALRGRKKAVTFVGAAAALLGAGTATAASAATVSPAAHSRPAATALSQASTARRPASANLSPISQKAVSDALATVDHAVSRAATAAASAKTAPVKAAAKTGTAAASPKTAPAKTAPVKAATAAKTGTAAASPKTAPAKTAPAKTVAVRGSAKPAAPKAESWSQIEQAVAKQTSPSEPKAADQLMPVGTAGGQAWMQLSGTQVANASTIVRQALHKQMGVRSAVIAVATSMQESQLQNINYGDRDSLGLFQQRPSCGWGTEQQILTPKYAADAFLTALAQHQAGDPGWVHQPLWASAQSVQNSGVPFAYAKWETQAAHLVKQIVSQVK